MSARAPPPRVGQRGLLSDNGSPGTACASPGTLRHERGARLAGVLQGDSNSGEGVSARPARMLSVPRCRSSGYLSGFMAAGRVPALFGPFRTASLLQGDSRATTGDDTGRARHDQPLAEGLTRTTYLAIAHRFMKIDLLDELGSGTPEGAVGMSAPSSGDESVVLLSSLMTPPFARLPPAYAKTPPDASSEASSWCIGPTRLTVMPRRDVE